MPRDLRRQGNKMTVFKKNLNTDLHTSSTAAHKQPSKKRNNTIAAAQSTPEGRINNAIDTRPRKIKKSKKEKHRPRFPTQSDGNK